MLAMGSPLRFSDYAGPRGIDSHELGADSQEVLAQMASIKGSQFDELARAGAFGKK
jgi:crotonobetainyl-CoA:carnitine CoA-transferase CaiB-like acyl-CoA transferase